MPVHFSCTKCGGCCHDLRLPLAVDEARAWIERGGDVQLFCDAIVWPQEPPADDGLAQHRRRRSFAALSGTLPVRVSVTLVAAFDGACPNLRPDMSCGAYAERPRVCRIYPAEVNPFVTLDPAAKACPADAWSTTQPLLMRAGRLVDADTAKLVAQSHEADERDRTTKAYLCALLGYDTAALANEGVAIYTPPRASLASALHAAQRACTPFDDPQPRSPYPWRLLTNRETTLTTLHSVGATADLTAHAPDQNEATPTYMGFFPDEPAMPPP
jgi:Fe-S-cluster containining protein